jgi:HlyD family type I secretion membrane fusion protein
MGQIGFLAILIAFGAGGTWAALAPLTSAIIASGVLKVTDNRKTVQHLEGGIVKEILVRDGERVEAGQPLITLQDERVSATLQLLLKRRDARHAKAARLRAERDYLPTPVFSDDLYRRAEHTRVADILMMETRLFATGRRALQRQLELLASQAAEIDREIDSHKAQLHAEETAADLLAQELAANERLRQRQAVATVTVLGLKRRLEEYRARRSALNAAIARARQRAAELELRGETLRNEYTKSAADGLAVVENESIELEERLRVARDAVRRQSVEAPIGGDVVALKVFTVGGVIRPGEPLLDIVPSAEPLMIEVRLNVDDIDNVRLGMLADVRLTAYAARTTPLLSGTLEYFSADQLIDPTTGTPHYVAHIRVVPKSLAGAGEINLLPGMHAEVFLKTAERTALDYLLGPMTESLRRALREP